MAHGQPIENATVMLLYHFERKGRLYDCQSLHQLGQALF
jgi:hypothetical protein